MLPRKIILNSIFTAFGVGLAVIILLYTSVTAKDVVASLNRLNYSYLALTMFFLFLVNVCSAERWRVILKGISKNTNFSFAFLLHFSALGLLYNSALPYVGTIGLKTTALSVNSDVPVEKGLLSTLIEQVVDIFLLFALFLPSLLFFTGLASIEQVFFLMMIVAFGVVFIAWVKPELLLYKFIIFYDILVRLIKKILSKEAKNNLKDLNKKTYSRTGTSWIALCSLFKNAFLLCRAYCMMKAIGIDIQLINIFAIAPVTQVICLLPTPIALGTSEAGWFFSLDTVSIDHKLIGTFVITERFALIFAQLMICLFCYLYYTIFNSRSLANEKK